MPCALRADKHYLKLLQLAKIGSEEQVSEAIGLLLEASEPPTPTAIKSLMDVYEQERLKVHVADADLSIYDQLLSDDTLVSGEVKYDA